MSKTLLSLLIFTLFISTSLSANVTSVQEMMETLDNLGTCQINLDNKKCSEIIEYNGICYEKTIKLFRMKTYESDNHKIILPEIQTTVRVVACD
jgi:outer membrane lipoprotein-sorting protein